MILYCRHIMTLDVGVRSSPQPTRLAIFVISTAGRDLKPALAQILPLRVDGKNQPVLLLPPPFLDLFFPGYCRVNIGRFFEIDQFVDVVFLGETWNLLCPVLMHPPFEIVGDANVHDLVVLVRQQVDVETRHVGCKISPCCRNDSNGTPRNDNVRWLFFKA